MKCYCPEYTESGYFMIDCILETVYNIAWTEDADEQSIVKCVAAPLSPSPRRQAPAGVQGSV